MLKKLSTSLIASIVLFTGSALSVNAAEASKAQATPKPVCPGSFIDGQKRKTQLMGKSVGKKVQEAFEFYSADDIQGAIDVLVDVEPEEKFDIATRARYLSVFYVQRGKGDDVKTAKKFLQEVVDLNILTENEHAESLKLLADLQLQDKEYQKAIDNFYAWIKFTCKEEGSIYVKIANAYYELKQLDKIIEPADKAIKADKKKPNQNPYILKVTSYYERKMFKEAIDVLETVVQVFPETKQWWVQLGFFYLLVEDNAKSLQTLEIAYKQGFLEKESEIKTLVSLYSANSMPYKAAVTLKKHMDEGLIKRDDKNLVTLGNAWHSSMHLDKAAKVFSEVSKLTNEAKHYSRQGTLYVQDEQFKKGIVALNKAIELKAKKPGSLHMTVAEAHFYLGEYKQAYKAIKKAMEYPKTKKSATSWAGFIKETARRKGVTVS